MNIKNIPETYDELERFNVEFERTRFAYSEAGHRVALVTMEMFVAKIPGLPKRLGMRGVCALLDEPLLTSLGLPKQTAGERRAVEGALKARARALRLFPARRKPRLRTQLRRPAYPNGYRIEELGPPPPSRAPGHA